MADIFISYKSEERDVAERLADRLRDAGYDVWWDTDLYAAQPFSSAIEKELEQARAVVILWSKASVESLWVQSEASDALKRKVAVGVIIDDLAVDDLPLPFRQLQAARLKGWNGRSDHKAFRYILSSIERLISPSQLEPSAPPPQPRPPGPFSTPLRRWTLAGAALAIVAATVGLVDYFTSWSLIPPDSGFVYYSTHHEPHVPPDGRLLQPGGEMPPYASIDVGTVLKAGDQVSVRKYGKRTDFLFPLEANECVRVTGAGVNPHTNGLGVWFPVTRATCLPFVLPSPPESGWVWAGTLDPHDQTQSTTGLFVEVVRRSQEIDRPYPVREGDVLRPLKPLNLVIVDWMTRGLANQLVPPQRSKVDRKDYTGKKLEAPSTFIVDDVNVIPADDASDVWLRVCPEGASIPKNSVGNRCPVL